MSRSKAKKDQEIWKAVAEDMKGKKINPGTGKVIKKRPAPKPKAPPKPKAKRPTR